ncbi:MAG TPA: SGNH/GDSL hydrolase family protein [Actinocrinis sp.]|nr:SGNH/GDSL hydrolase family protein [Actinocrinis sp.]
MTGTTEATDPYCLRPGEAETLLAGHPWRRFVVLGDSIAEGVGEPVPGYPPLPIAHRVAAELSRVRPELAVVNLGRRNLRARQVRERQLVPALAFEPDLALVVCGANDALRPGYETRAGAVDGEIETMVRAMQGRGATVITLAVFVWPNYPHLPSWLKPTPSERMAMLGRRTTELAARLGTVHIDVADHPAAKDPDTMSIDGLHGNGRSQAILAAEIVRRLGAHLRAQ